MYRKTERESGGREREREVERKGKEMGSSDLNR